MFYIYLPESANRGGAGAQSVTVKSVVGSIPTRGNEIFILNYISISLLWCRGEVRR